MWKFRQYLHARTINCVKWKMHFIGSNNPNTWFGRFPKIILDLRCKRIQENRTLFLKHSELGRVTILLIYIDDIIVIRDDEKKN